MVCAAVHVQREEIPELPLWYRVLNEQGDCVEAVHRRLGHPALPPRGYIHHGNTIKERGYPSNRQHRVLLRPAKAQLLPLQADGHHAPDPPSGDDRHLR